MEIVFRMFRFTETSLAAFEIPSVAISDALKSENKTLQYILRPLPLCDPQRRLHSLALQVETDAHTVFKPVKAETLRKKKISN